MKINPLIRTFLFFAIVVCLTGGNFHSGLAQQVTGEIVSFSQLAQKEIVLQGPLDVQSFTFNLPANWEISSGSVLHINYNAFFNNTDSAPNATTAGYIQVNLDNIPIGTILMDNGGENSIDIPIPDVIWIISKQKNTTHSLEFTLKTAELCRPTNPAQTTAFTGLNVIVRSNSYFVLPHGEKPINIDLRKLPYPLYQDSFIPDKVILVMPDNPSEAELQAALITSAAFGRLTNGLLSLNAISASKLDQTALSDSHLIFVGKPSDFSQLGLATWPAPLNGTGFSATQIGPDDGVLQMVISPLNPARVWLLVSGQNDAGVVKSAQALGGGQIRVEGNSDLSIVSATQPTPITNTGLVDHTFSDLGYSTETRWGPGLRYIVYKFQVPPEEVVSQDAYLNFVFSHSSLFDFDQAGFSISLNDDYIGGFRFSDRTAQVSDWRLNLPPSSFRPGENSLIVEVNLEPTTRCVPNQELWFNARSESLLHLPTQAAPNEIPSIALNNYPAPFVPNLDKTAFVLAKNDPEGWNAASRIAFNLGIKTGGTVIDPIVVFADNVPDTVKNERDLFLIGRPSTMPIVQDLAGSMLAKFDKGSDIANEPAGAFSFHVAPTAPVGYLQVFSAPWNPQHFVMMLSGNSGDGLKWGADALLIPDQRSQLTGNLAVIYNGQIIATQVDNQPIVAPDVTPTAAPTSQPGQTGSGGFNMLTISAIVVVILLGLGLLVWRIGAKRTDR